MAETIAIGANGKVSLWCNSRGTSSKGERFFVINGGWYGYIKDSILTVSEKGYTHPAEILWRGEVPTHTTYIIMRRYFGYKPN